ncbi:LPS assembly lipoprotein LptE [Hymenobacter volaticus]|uniref:LPS assembly lipoprotein LptE n=1 Tax=Hymenobacter volaticus TaxID=2932254 RepID=A0ABY4G1J1_9BACT|nr:LptE family protein [Hymenobacter volaticus]UOQ64449.1 LPS assembly lipoprotein LptE [Hymenobacter volaticus]
MTWNKRNWLASPLTWMLSCSLILTLALTGCSVYSFSGTNIDPAVKTISIATFQNTSNNGPSYLPQRFTEDFKDYFQRNTTIKQVPRDGDLQFEGEIIAFDYAPAAIQQQNGQDQAGVNRLTMQVRIKFTNTKDPKQDFEQTFQSNRDFPATQDIARINNDPTAVRTITQNIITDAFNKSVANW